MPSNLMTNCRPLADIALNVYEKSQIKMLLLLYFTNKNERNHVNCSIFSHKDCASSRVIPISLTNPLLIC